MGNINITLQIQHPSAVSNTIRYARVDNTLTPVYTTIPNVTGTTYTIQNLANGQYRIFVKPNYSDGRVCPEQQLLTDACTGIVMFSAVYSAGSFVISFNAGSTVPKVQLNVAFPNGGSDSPQYDNVPGDIIYAPPAGVYGTFSLTLQPVCDPDSGFLGARTAPINLVIEAPANMTITNGTAGGMTPVTVTTNGVGGSVLVYNTSSLPISIPQNLLIPDGTYSSIVVNYGSGTVGSASLVTGSGSYPGVLTANTITFNTVNMSGGGSITIS